jgi:low temperature requirement protein LtrA
MYDLLRIQFTNESARYSSLSFSFPSHWWAPIFLLRSASLRLGLVENKLIWYVLLCCYIRMKLTSDCQNFWLLSATLCFSRMILAIQYTVVLCAPTRPARFKLPLLLNIVVFIVSGAIFIGFTGVFTRAGDEVNAGSSMAYVTWYLVLVFEVVATIQISHLWKEVNFTHTHLTERMGLLTFIVIGEGAIGASKTTIEMMGRRELEIEPILLVVCIVLILVSWQQSPFDLTSADNS